jgi:pimeloyl-ACP methyl ester carboxylesterase
LTWRGHRVCVSERGAGSPLLLLPGIGCSADMWAPFMAFFRDRRLISFDPPGTGRSSTPLYPVSIAALAALAAEVLDHCNVAVTDVIGFSYGGAVSQQLAYDHPHRVARLVLAATNCGWGSFWGSPEAIAMAMPLRFCSASYYGYAMQLLGGMGWSSLSFLPQIPHETLVICGGDDPLVPVANGRMLAERIPRAELTVVERAGHLFLWDEPERAAPRIARFVSI